jgi:hypothetical protein
MRFALPVLALAATSSAAPLEERQNAGGNGPYGPVVSSHMLRRPRLVTGV